MSFREGDGGLAVIICTKTFQDREPEPRFNAPGGGVGGGRGGFQGGPGGGMGYGGGGGYGGNMGGGNDRQLYISNVGLALFRLRISVAQLTFSSFRLPSAGRT